MRHLVIGSTGQLARALAALDADAVFLGRDRVDLARPEAVEQAVAALAPDVVINAAAYTAVDQAEADAATAFAVNRDGVAALARAAARVNAAFLHISTDYVFDGAKSGEWTESDPTGPLSVYGASKLAGEQAALDLHPRTLILRTSWLYAPWGTNFLTTMLRLAERERLSVVADQTGKPTSALDLAEAIVAIAPLLAEALEAAPVWGVRHYAGAGVTTWADFAREIFSRATAQGLIARAPEVAPISAADWPAAASRPANSALDCTRFERDFGIATVPWRDALARAIDARAAATAQT